MIPRVGVDLVPVRGVEALVADQDGSALRRMLTALESENCTIHVEGGVECSPAIRFTGNALSLASSAGIRSGISISISHVGDYVVAVAAAISTCEDT